MERGWTKSVDVLDEIARLFNKEQIVAFFEFDYALTPAAATHGLCKLSRPKPGRSTLNYMGLFFVVDVPDQTAWQRVDESMRAFETGSLKLRLEKLDYTILTTPVNAAPPLFVKQIDLVFFKTLELSDKFIATEFYPAICAEGALKSEGLTFCEGLNELPALKSLRASSADLSLVKQLAELIHKKVGTYQ